MHRTGDRVMWLSGQVGLILASQPRPDLGVMGQPRSLSVQRMEQLVEAGIPLAFDNGAFKKFNERVWLSWIEKVPPAVRDAVLFAVCPDVVNWDTGQPVGDPVATMKRFWAYAPMLKAMGYRVAYATQDGCTSELVPWDEIGCLFIGGSDAWKFCHQSVSLIREAQRRGLWVHCGRVQPTGQKMRTAHALGVNSSDGTVLAFDPARLPRVQSRLAGLNAQLAMEGT